MDVRDRPGDDVMSGDQSWEARLGGTVGGVPGSGDLETLCVLEGRDGHDGHGHRYDGFSKQMLPGGMEMAGRKKGRGSS